MKKQDKTIFVKANGCKFGVIVVNDDGTALLKYFDEKANEITDVNMFTAEHEWYKPIVEEAFKIINRTKIVKRINFGY